MSYFVGASICVLWLFPLDMLKNWEYLEKISTDVPVDIPMIFSLETRRIASNPGPSYALIE